MDEAIFSRLRLRQAKISKLVRQVGTPLGAPLSVSSIQNLPELAVSPKETDPHRNRRNPETGSHFLCGKLHHIAEKAYVPQFRR